VERGGADGAGSAFPSELRWMDLSPHPSREGRGSLPAGWVWLSANRGGERESGGGRMSEDEQISTVMGLMHILNSDILHRLAWI
jgi:hypothetical protein